MLVLFGVSSIWCWIRWYLVQVSLGVRGIGAGGVWCSWYLVLTVFGVSGILC